MIKNELRMPIYGLGGIKYPTLEAIDISNSEIKARRVKGTIVRRPVTTVALEQIHPVSVSARPRHDKETPEAKLLFNNIGSLLGASREEIWQRNRWPLWFVFDKAINVEDEAVVSASAVANIDISGWGIGTLFSIDVIGTGTLYDVSGLSAENRLRLRDGAEIQVPRCDGLQATATFNVSRQRYDTVEKGNITIAL